MWRYEIVAQDGECLESGMFSEADEMTRYCERRMKRLKAANWFGEADETEKEE